MVFLYFPDCIGHCIPHHIVGTFQVTPLTAHYNAALAASAEAKRLALTILEFKDVPIHRDTWEHLQKLQSHGVAALFQDVPRYLREWKVTLFLLERMQQDEAHHLWFYRSEDVDLPETRNL